MIHEKIGSTKYTPTLACNFHRAVGQTKSSGVLLLLVTNLEFHDPNDPLTANLHFACAHILGIIG